MTNVMVRWGMGDFKKWGGILVMRDDFEMGGGGDTPLWTIWI